jgi:hypothetical protein
VSIHYSVSGAGDPALVFVHCWTCRRRLWDAHPERFNALLAEAVRRVQAAVAA